MNRPKKSLAQHFLVDKNVINKIIKKARIEPSDVVLEIGAGKGELTFSLAEEVEHVFAIEKDTDLFNRLKQNIENCGVSNITPINADILKWEFAEVGSLVAGSGKKDLLVIGNVPYNISSPIIFKLIKNKCIIKRAVLMFQVEFAKRLIAQPNTKDYGAITLILRYHARVRKLFEVSRNVFFPRPAVDSMVVEMIFDRLYPDVKESVFNLIVHAAFAYRRKKLINSLAQYLGINKGEIEDVLKRCGIDPDRRAESLSMDDFLKLVSHYERTFAYKKA